MTHIFDSPRKGKEPAGTYLKAKEKLTERKSGYQAIGQEVIRRTGYQE